MSENQDDVDPQVESHAWLCAERGWRGTFTLKSGDVIADAFVTATDQEKKFVVLERVGERDRPPHLIDLRNVSSVEVHWKVE